MNSLVFCKSHFIVLDWKILKAWLLQPTLLWEILAGQKDVSKNITGKISKGKSADVQAQAAMIQNVVECLLEAPPTNVSDFYLFIFFE